MGLTLDPLDPYAGRSNGSDGSRLDPGGWRLVAGGWWLVAAGFWLLMVGADWIFEHANSSTIHQHDFLWTAPLF